MKLRRKYRLWCTSCLMPIASGLYPILRASSGPFRFPPKTHHSYVCRFAHPNCVSAASSQGCLPFRGVTHVCSRDWNPGNPASLTRGSSKRERENWSSGGSRGRLLTIKPFPMGRGRGLVTEHWMWSQEFVLVLALSLSGSVSPGENFICVSSFPLGRHSCCQNTSHHLLTAYCMPGTSQPP